MIDEALIDPWPAELIEALEGWKQGDVIKEPPFLYAADLSRPLHGLALAMAAREAADGYDPVSGDLMACEAEDVASRPPYGIIATQTCDLSERGRPAQPWFQVAPVYRSSRPADATLPRYQVRLDGPEFTSERWVADLRIEVPVEKTALIDRTPIAAFASETGYIAFGARLGHRQARAALADELEAAVVQPLRNRLRKNAASRKVRARTYGWGLRIAEGERLRPVAVKLYVYFDGPLQAAEDDPREAVSEHAREWYEKWWDSTREHAEQAGFRLLENEYLDAGQADLSVYDQLIKLDLAG